MSPFNSMRFIIACFVALLMLWHIYDEEKAITSVRPQIYMYGCIFPVYLLALAVTALLLYDPDIALNFILTMSFDTFLMISLYYGIMSLMVKALRNVLRAKACALLWLVPNYLYFLQRGNMGMEQDHPLLILQLPGKWAPYALLIWFLGLLIILSRRTMGHLAYRRFLLRASRPITEEAITKIWSAEKERLDLHQKPYRLVASVNTRTPLSIGLLEKSIVVVLPEKAYSPEEVTLILRHELTHIYRGDSFTKLFLTICTAMCWFNPLMWLAMKKCAEDLELSCDEQVLQEASSQQRRQYADLILNTAGDERGFTTCLSASASALAYRLRSIMKPEKKRWGGILVAAVFLVLAMCCGHISLAYTEETGAEVIYREEDPSQFRIHSISLPNGKKHSILECREPGLLAEYLSGLTLSRITGEYAFSQSDRELHLLYYHDHNQNLERISIRDQILITTPYNQGRVREQYYTIQEPIDWTYLQSLMEYGPSLILHIPTEAGIQTASATLYNLDRIQNGEAEPVRRGSETTDIFHLVDETTDRIILQFTHAPIDYSVTIENWKRTESKTLTQSDLQELETIPLPQPSGHYTIKAILQGEKGLLYDAEFRFDIYDAAYEEMLAVTDGLTNSK